MKTDTETNSTESKVDHMAHQAHETVDRVAEAANQAAERMNERRSEMKGQQEEWLSTVSNYVQDNPLTSLGIAAAGGYLLSRILSGR